MITMRMRKMMMMAMTMLITIEHTAVEEGVWEKLKKDEGKDKEPISCYPTKKNN